MTAIDERDSISGDHTAASFEEVIAYGLDHDAVLLDLPAAMREKLTELGTFVGATAARQAYKTLKSWPTRIPSSTPQQDFQQAIDEACAYLERWMCSAAGTQAPLRKLSQP